MGSHLRAQVTELSLFLSLAVGHKKAGEELVLGLPRSMNYCIALSSPHYWFFVPHLGGIIQHSYVMLCYESFSGSSHLSVFFHGLDGAHHEIPVWNENKMEKISSLCPLR